MSWVSSCRFRLGDKNLKISHLFGKLPQESVVEQWGIKTRTGGKPTVNTQQASYHCGQGELNPAEKLKISLEYTSELYPKEMETGLFFSSASIFHCWGPTPREINYYSLLARLSFEPRESPYRESPKCLYWNTLNMDLNVTLGVIGGNNSIYYNMLTKTVPGKLRHMISLLMAPYIRNTYFSISPWVVYESEEFKTITF